jgi:hypothetical protein
MVEWLDNAGDAIAFAQHLQLAPLNGMAAKPVLFQMARGDQIIPNPTSSALSRAAGLEKSTWLYRHDIARQTLDGIPENPHSYLELFLGVGGGTISLPSLSAVLIGLATQSQVAGFLASDGKTIPDMNDLFPGPYFEIPTNLPDDTGIQPQGQALKRGRPSLGDIRARSPRSPSRSH